MVLELSTAPASPAVLAVCVGDDKASERLLLKVVRELAVAKQQEHFSGLHLLTAAFTPEEYSKPYREDVRKFVHRRFMTILDELPDCVDWKIHAVSIHQQTFNGEPVRKSQNPDAKRILAAALCREAHKLQATELIVNEQVRSGPSFHPSLAHYLVKYSRTDVKLRLMRSNSSSKEHMGLGLDSAKVPLGAEEEEQAPTPNHWRIPKDQTDVLSSYKAIARGLRWVLGVPASKGYALA